MRTNATSGLYSVVSMTEIKAVKRLGQHFLRDEGIITQLLAAIDPKPQQKILEIGPGLGALTLPVLERCHELYAVELDHRVLQPLSEKAAAVGILHLIERDILNIHFAEVAPSPIRIIGNLPYNLSSPILFHCVAQRSDIVDMHFMLQKEVVDRITAPVDTPAYGRLSVMIQLYCQVEALFDVPPEAFAPPPKVNSAVVRLIPQTRLTWNIESIAHFECVVRSAFSQRRKMLRKSLAAYFEPKELMALDVDPTARAETIDGASFARLANALYLKEKNL